MHLREDAQRFREQQIQRWSQIVDHSSVMCVCICEHVCVCDAQEVLIVSNQDNP